MEDRSLEIRAFLAILLSILFLYLYQAYIMKPQTQAKGEKKETEEVLRLPPRMPLHPSGEEVEVETEKMIARISGDGSIVSLKLKEYKMDIEEPDSKVELVRVLTPPYPLSVFFYPEGSTEPVIFSGEITKTASEVMVTGSVGNLKVWKKFSFGKGYTIGLSLIVKNISAEPARFSMELIWSAPHLAISRVYNESFKGYVKGEVRSRNKLKKAEAIGDAEWIAHDMKYFLGAIIPVFPPFMNAVVYPFMEKDIISFKTSLMVLPPQGEEGMEFLIYCGPKMESLLRSTRAGLEKSIDLGWFEFLAKPILSLIKFFYRFVPNYGVVIIFIVIIIKVLFFPLTRMQYRAMKKMKEIQPLIESAKKRYADDKERLQREILNIYRSYRVNPLSGCLPLLIQFPVFIALYQVLMNAIELRHAPFFWWIKDLSSPESIGKIDLGGFVLHIRVLPLLLGITTYIQQKLSPQTEGEEAMKWMMKIMPVLLTILFWAFPSGLVLYWCTNNILSIMEQLVMRLLAKRG